MGKISRTRGVQNERAIAKLLGAKRNHFEAEDLRHSLLSVECKERKKGNLPEYLKKWMDQAAQAAPDGQIPCVVIHEGGRKRTEDLVLIRFSDLIAIMDRLGEGANDNGSSEATTGAGRPAGGEGEGFHRAAAH